MKKRCRKRFAFRRKSIVPWVRWCRKPPLSIPRTKSLTRRRRGCNRRRLQESGGENPCCRWADPSVRDAGRCASTAGKLTSDDSAGGEDRAGEEPSTQGGIGRYVNCVGSDQDGKSYLLPHWYLFTAFVGLNLF